MLLQLALVLSNPAPTGLPPIAREFRAAWVATVDNIDWPNKRGEAPETERRELIRILDTAHRLHLNAIILQVRPSADALYPSDYEPWSEYLTGKQGKPPSPIWDPLAFAVAEAHKRGLELHAWFNPYRAMSPAQKGPNSDNHISKTHPEVVKQYGKLLWMDPGEPLVREHTLNVMLDVVRRYDVDGIHMDDYFYPYRDDATDKAHADFPDDRSWGRYLASRGSSGRGLTRSSWRRQNVNQFVERLYNGIKHLKPWVKFGISPFGIYRPGIPAGIHAGVDQYEELYADARLWLNNGWCDYFTPQLYWPIAQKPQAYGTLLKWWVGENAKSRHIWPGNYTSRIDPGVGKWQLQEVLDQIDVTRATHQPYELEFSGGAAADNEPEAGATGNVHFSFRVFMRDTRKIDEALMTGKYNRLALVPPSPWLARGGRPTLKSEHGALATGSTTRFVAWCTKVDDGWTPWEIGDLQAAAAAARRDTIAAVAIDRCGRVSPAVLFQGATGSSS
ncbi:MAG TPA: family 10 glycosylhydrolase [Fimbriimonadaceae bacterium]|nr:family 10 glycosylhydrolase [Fimbriimonadaceae bacterium]